MVSRGDLTPGDQGPDVLGETRAAKPIPVEEAGRSVVEPTPAKTSSASIPIFFARLPISFAK